MSLKASGTWTRAGNPDRIKDIAEHPESWLFY